MKSVMSADIQELLPFWANGTLTEVERQRVEAALAQSSELRKMAADVQGLRAIVQATPAVQSPGELGLARLMRAIAAESAQTSATQPHRAGRRSGLLMAATAAIAAALSSLLTLGLTRPEAPVYEQASGDDPAAELTVTFRAEATEAAISALLRAKGLVIVDGPSAIGLYRLGLPYDIDPAEATRYLQAAPDVIATVESPE